MVHCQNKTCRNHNPDNSCKVEAQVKTVRIDRDGHCSDAIWPTLDFNADQLCFNGKELDFGF